MAKGTKRFINGEMWDKDWFLDLPLKMKLAWIYIFTNCNHGGIWDIQLKRMSFSLQIKVTIDEVWEHLGCQLIPLKGNKVYLKKFLYQQYNIKSIDDLGESPVHKGIRKKISSYEEEIKGILRVNKGYTKPLLTVKDKDKVKVKIKYNSVKSMIGDKELFSKLKDKFPTKDVDMEFERFQDNLLAKGKKHSNYLSAFRNWLRSPYCLDKEIESKNNKLKEKYGTR